MENNGYDPFPTACKAVVLPLTPIPQIMKTIEKRCPICDKLFEASIKEVNRGNAKVCSRKCGRISSSLKNTKLKQPNVKCSYCSKDFYLSPSKIKSSKSGLHFCCREHKDLAQRIEFDMKDLWPIHYKTGKYASYRTNALQHYGSRCQLCGYDKHECVLQIHHIDHNRENNLLTNLLVCCPTCHVEQHILDNKVQFYNKLRL